MAVEGDVVRSPITTDFHPGGQTAALRLTNRSNNPRRLADRCRACVSEEGG